MAMVRIVLTAFVLLWVAVAHAGAQTPAAPPALTAPEELGKKMRDEIVRWGKVVKASGMKID